MVYSSVIFVLAWSAILLVFDAAAADFLPPGNIRAP
jgi:hypothetical protein